MTLISIGTNPENLIPMPQPQKYSFPMQDVIGENAFNENGEQFRDRIRPGVISLDLAWTVASDDAMTLLSAIAPDKVSVSFFDPRINDYKTSEMFVGDRSCELVVFENADSETNLWSIGFTLTEY